MAPKIGISPPPEGTDNVEALPLSQEQLDAGKGFAAANFQADTNFTIKVGRHQWKVHTVLMSKASTYFNSLCNGAFRESHEKAVDLVDESPVDFIRLLQFIYTNNYDRQPGDSSASEHLPFTRFLGHDEQSKRELAIEMVRDKMEIDEAVLRLARKYDVPALREFIAVKLVRQLPSTDIGQNYRQGIRSATLFTFMPKFMKTFELIEEDLHELQQINERLVDEIFSFMLEQYDENTRIMPGFLFDPEPAAFAGGSNATPVDPKIRAVQKQLEKCVSENSSFALEVIKGYQRMCGREMRSFKWTFSRKCNLRQFRHRYDKSGRLVRE